MAKDITDIVSQFVPITDLGLIGAIQDYDASHGGDGSGEALLARFSEDDRTTHHNFIRRLKTGMSVIKSNRYREEKLNPWHYWSNRIVQHLALLVSRKQVEGTALTIHQAFNMADREMRAESFTAFSMERVDSLIRMHPNPRRKNGTRVVLSTPALGRFLKRTTQTTTPLTNPPNV